MHRRTLKNHLALGCLLAVTLALGACGADTTASPAASGIAPTTPPAATPAPAPAAAVTNNAPTITGTPGATATAGTGYLFQPTASDADGDSLAFSAQGLPAWLILDASTGRLNGTPADADVGLTADIVLSVTDGKATSSLAPFRIQIAARAAPPAPPAGSAPPTLSGTPPSTVAAGTAYSFAPLANDPDSTTLSFSIANKPAWASFSSVTGVLQGTPARTQTGTYAGIVIRVSDGTTQVALPAFTIQVTAAPNTPPTITGTPGTTATAGTAYSFTPSAADIDGQALAFSIAGKPAWATFSTATGSLTGTPAAANMGTFSGIVISVSDGTAATALPAFTLTVQAAPNRAPTLTGTALTSVTAGNAYSFTPTGADPDGNTLTYSISGMPAWASFNTATGQLSGTPSAAQVGSYANIVISVSDGTLSASLPAFSITVNAIATGSATLSWTPPTQNTDGSALTTLAGYWIYYGTNSASLSSSVQLTNSGLSSYVVGNLSSGTYYFAITAYNAAGAESAMTNVGSKTIP